MYDDWYDQLWSHYLSEYDEHKPTYNGWQSVRVIMLPATSKEVVRPKGKPRPRLPAT